MDGWVDWSPDGQEIAFVSTRSGSWDIWAIPPEGGEPRRVTTEGFESYPFYSSDGELLFFYADPQEGARGIWMVPSIGGDPEFVAESLATGGACTPDGEHLFFVKLDNVWAFSQKDGTEYPVTDLSGRRGALFYGFLATDGEYIYFNWEEDIGDIWVMDAVYK
jgi:Tol biopolymer transport system component